MNRLKLTVLPPYWNGVVPRMVCATEQRPCRREDCDYHLREKQPRSIEEMRETCAIDVAERIDDDGNRGASLREIGDLMGISNEMVCKIQRRALRKYRTGMERG